MIRVATENREGYEIRDKNNQKKHMNKKKHKNIIQKQ